MLDPIRRTAAAKSTSRQRERRIDVAGSGSACPEAIPTVTDSLSESRVTRRLRTAGRKDGPGVFVVQAATRTAARWIVRRDRP